MKRRIESLSTADVKTLGDHGSDVALTDKNGAENVCRKYRADKGIGCFNHGYCPCSVVIAVLSVT